MGRSAAVDRPAAIGWREAAGAAAFLVQERPALVAVGLLGFLGRGGLALFLLPIVALPTPIGISTFIGGTALTGSGASDSLILLIAVGIAIVTSLIVLGAVLGAIADILLGVEAMAFVLARTGRSGRPVQPVSATLVARVLLIRIVGLIPIGIAVAWATSRLVEAGYHQLILPDDLSVPLAIRIIREALDAALVVVAVWLASEFVAGLAARQAVLRGRSVAPAYAFAALDILRRPLTSIATYGLGVLGVAAVAIPTLVLAAPIWSRLQAFLADDVAVTLLLPATFVFVAIWGGGLFVVGTVAAWRSILGGIDLLRADHGRAPASPG